MRKYSVLLALPGVEKEKGSEFVWRKYQCPEIRRNFLSGRKRSCFDPNFGHSHSNPIHPSLESDPQGFGVGSRAGPGAQTTFLCSKTEAKNPIKELINTIDERINPSCKIQFCFLSHRSMFVTAPRGAVVTKETYVVIYLILKCHLEAVESFKC